jgi:hypothetical protein
MRRRRNLAPLGYLALILVAGGGAHAGAQTAPTDSPPMASPAPDAPVDPERLALARQLIASTHAETAMSGAIAQVFRSIPAPPPGSAAGETMRGFGTSLGSAYQAAMPELVDDMARIYARTFTKQELRDVIAFDATPSGQAFVSKTPEMTRQLVPFMLAQMPKIFAAAERDYCARQTCTEAEHKAFEAMRSRVSPAAAPGAASAPP